MTAKLGITLDIKSLSNIPPLLDSSLEAPGKVQGHGSATLTAERFDDWSLTSIGISFDGANQGTFSGSVKHFPATADYALIANFRRLSAGDLPAFDMLETLKPENIRAYVQINKTPSQDNFSFDNIDANFSMASGIATANIVGSVADIVNMAGLSLQIGLRSIPYKLFTISAGVLNMALVPFILASLLGRGVQYFVVAAVAWFGGDKLESSLRKWVDWLGWGIVLLAVLAFWYFKH